MNHFYEKIVSGDGNCQFRAMADQLWDDDTYHPMVRQQTCDYIDANKNQFRDFVEYGTLEAFVAEMRNVCATAGDRQWGNGITLKAMGKRYQTDITVVYHSGQPSQEFRCGQSESPMCYLSYDGGHYNSLRPTQPSALFQSHSDYASQRLAQRMQEQADKELARQLQSQHQQCQPSAPLHSQSDHASQRLAQRMQEQADKELARQLQSQHQQRQPPPPFQSQSDHASQRLAQADAEFARQLQSQQQQQRHYQLPARFQPERMQHSHCPHVSASPAHRNFYNTVEVSENTSMFSSRPMYRGRADVRERHHRLSWSLFGHGSARAKALVIR